MFSAAGTRAMEGAVDDRILSVQDAQFTLNLDYTLAPILRRDVPQAEWSKNRLLWARLGFEYGTSGSSGSGFVPVQHRHRRTQRALSDGGRRCG